MSEGALEARGAQKGLQVQAPAHMVEKWAAKCPQRMIRNGETASSWMAKMGITDELLAGSGVSVGDWPQPMLKISASIRTTRIRNNPPLREGDLVLIHPGNGLK